MIEDQVQVSLISLAVALSVAASSASVSPGLRSGRYLLRAVFGSLGVAVGIFLTLFAISGFGWGWSDLSAGRELFLLVMGGLCIGLFHAAFGWMVSRRMRPLLAGGLLVANIAVLLIPSHYGIWRWTAFVLANFLLLTLWLAKARPREADP